MSLLEKISTTTRGREIGAQMLHKLHLALNDDSTKAMIDSFRAELENIDNSEGTFVVGRVKAPISSAKKFSEAQKYQGSWNSVKDLVAFTIVVEGNNDKVDRIRKLLVKKYEEAGMQNKHSSQIYEDFMRKSVRQDPVSRALYVYQDPTGKYYQTNDGYKTVRLNVMLGDYPVEIQVKTLQQYIAHYATHDAIYKAPKYLFEGGSEEDAERFIVSDKMFPYFEAQAYLRLYKNKLSPEQIAAVIQDIKEIYTRNFEIYSKYAPVFNEARADFGVYMYQLMHRQEFNADRLLQKESTLLDFTPYEIKKVFKYVLKEVQTKDTYLPYDMAVSRAVDRLLDMPYDQFKQTSKSIKGAFRLPGCVLTGNFDGLDTRFINTLEKAHDLFRAVHIKVYSDDFSKALTGRNPIFSLEQRKYLISSCKYVNSVSEIEDFQSKPIESLSREEASDKSNSHYKLVSMTGVMDGCTPGHVMLKSFANGITADDGKVVVGIKSDKYVQSHKHKNPVNCEEDRAAIYSGLRGVDSVYITENDILPDEETIEEMRRLSEQGQPCAIITGSDWANPEKLKSKPQSSLDELKWIKENLPNVDIIPAPKRGEQNDFHTNDGKLMSSSNLRQALLNQKEETLVMPIELREMEE